MLIVLAEGSSREISFKICISPDRLFRCKLILSRVTIGRFLEELMFKTPYIKLFAIAIITFSLCLANISIAKEPVSKILVFGDSLVAGYELSLDDAFPAVLQKKLKKEGFDFEVINAGVSGDTTSGGLTRLEWTLEMKPDYIILELGANDMLRGINPKVTRFNLEKMLKIIKQKEIPVLLAGMKSAPNLGSAFKGEYEGVFKELAEKYNAVYYPFFLEGVINKRDLMQDDGLHPNKEGVKVMVHNIFDSVNRLLER